MTRAVPGGPVFPVVQNYRGRPVGAWLGAAYVGALVGSLLVAEVLDGVRGRPISAAARSVWWMAFGCLGVFLVGLYDDFRPSRTRGIVAQLSPLARGQVTPGAVKLFGILASSAVVAWGLGARGARFVLGAAVMAGCANLWNLLDVRPGRALKFFLPVCVALSMWAPGTAYPAIGATAVGAGLVALVPDLRERGMLGDGGAGVLGFVIGLGLLVTLPVWWLMMALVVLLALHAASEVVTLSRLIEAVPPIRWYDRVGRSGAADPSNEEGSTST